MPRYRHAVLGGTFDHFHVGHAALLARAFHLARDVSIGVTTDAYVASHAKPYPDRIQPYRARRRRLVRWIRSHYPGRVARVVPLANAFGRSTELGFDVLVVSADTLSGGRAVNEERRRLGRPPIQIDMVPVVLGDDLRPVSSRRIRAGEIDRRGRSTARLRVGYAAGDPADNRAIRAAIGRAFPRARLVDRSPRRPSRVAQGRQAARTLARRAVAGLDLGVAVVRRPRAGWAVLERSPTIELDPRNIPPATEIDLRRSITQLLRPHSARQPGL